MLIRPARPDELSELSDLCLDAKAYWGYDDAFLAVCRDELTIREDELTDTCLAVAEHDGEAVGVAQIFVEDGVCELQKLFVEPASMGIGVGRALFDWAAAEALRHGAVLMTIDSDPDAEPFYRRMGAEPVGTAPSASIEGRVLPRLELPLYAPYS